MDGDDKRFFAVLLGLLSAEIQRTKCGAEAYALGASDCKRDAERHQELLDTRDWLNAKLHA